MLVETVSFEFLCLLMGGNICTSIVQLQQAEVICYLHSGFIWLMVDCVCVCVCVCQLCVCVSGVWGVLLKDALQSDVGQDDTVAADCSLSAKPSKSLRVCFSEASGQPSAPLLFIH